MIVVKIGQGFGMFFHVGPRQAAAAEHQLYIVMGDIGADSLPQHLHGGPVAVRRVDAGPPQLKDLAGIGDELADVIFAGRIEPALTLRRLAADQPVSTDHVTKPVAPFTIDHQQMIAK